VKLKKKGKEKYEEYVGREGYEVFTATYIDCNIDSRNYI